ncbi:MAG: short chain dehydrogenase, partial [Aeromicrobium sp.]|nr:short chain dehydrogenase [Aeromicrobium sp.]
MVHHEAFDISDEDAVMAFAHRTLEAGPVDVVMNVAGISTWGRIQDLRSEHWRTCVEVDLMGPIHIMSALVPAMIDAGNGGHVVNVSSAAGLLGLPLHAPYSAAKFGLRGVSEVLRFDLEQHGIGVTLVCPGAVRTPDPRRGRCNSRLSPGVAVQQSPFRRRKGDSCTAQACLWGQ